jgi:hypothetical protein
VRSFAATHQQRGFPDDADLASALREHQPDPDVVDPERWDDDERRAAVADLQEQVRSLAADADAEAEDVVDVDGVGGLDDLPDEDPLTEDENPLNEDEDPPGEPDGGDPPEGADDASDDGDEDPPGEG